MTGHFRSKPLVTVDLQKYNHERYLENKRILKIQSKATCECGSKSKYAKFGRHLNSVMHIKYLNTLNI